MPFIDLMADVKAEQQILEKMEKSQMVAMPIGGELQPAALQLAFNKACEADYIRIVNIRNMDLPTPQGAAKAPCALYMLTDKGKARLAEHQARMRIDGAMGEMK